MVKSNYEILGVPENASRNEIRSAFRNLALTHHADRGGQDEEFIIIKQAFEDLKSGKKFPDSLDEKQRKSKFFWGTDEEERLRQNTLLSNDVAREIKVAQEWIDALNRSDVTGIKLFGSNELGQIEIERKPTGALSIKGKFWAGKILHSNHVFMWGSMTSPYFLDTDISKTLIHLTQGTFKLMDPLENGYNIENGSHIIVDNGDIVCGNVNGIRQQVPHPTGRVGMSIIKEHFTKLEAPNGKIIAGDVRETVSLDAQEVLVLNLIDNVIVKGKKISVFGPKVSYDVFFELKEGGMIRFYDKGSGFDISDDAIIKLENGKEFFLDDLKTRKLIGFGGQEMTYEFLDGLEGSSGVIPSNWASKLSGLFKKN
ncbi:MAG: J domain-containing protein [Candidatus Nitrosopelagicus sp.]|nr:J domain-containing protein [Candidatus Nitrosopelagicus sp.]